MVDINSPEWDALVLAEKCPVCNAGVGQWCDAPQKVAAEAKLAKIVGRGPRVAFSQHLCRQDRAMRRERGY